MIRLRSILINGFLVSLLLLPSLLSVKIGFLPVATLPRVLLVLGYLWTFLSKTRVSAFWESVKGCAFNLPLAFYLAVALFTAVVAGDINTFFGFFVDIYLLFYLSLFILKNYLSPDRFIEVVSFCLMLVCLFGLVEFLTGFNLFNTISISNTPLIEESYRDDLLRIRGPYGHPLAYGMVILILFPITCCDKKTHRIDLFRNTPLFVLISLNIFFTGSRSGIGIFVGELLILYLLTDRRYRARQLLISEALVFGVLGCVVFFSGNDVVQYFIRQASYVVDQLFGTTYSLKYGGDISVAASSIARERIWKIPFSGFIDPLFGRGTSSNGSYVIDGWLVTSIDNYYVRTYISYALGGVTAFALIIATFVRRCFQVRVETNDRLALLVLISGASYLINLLYVDELSTLKYLFIIAALVESLSRLSFVEGGDRCG